ncbi:MAG: TolC family protein [Comamonadaceae bacterium]|nr:MAG: TolC family protein [Comamonadaceae bacterium]
MSQSPMGRSRVGPLSRARDALRHSIPLAPASRKPLHPRLRPRLRLRALPALVLAACLGVAGCAGIAPDGDRRIVDALVAGHPLVPRPEPDAPTASPERRRALDALLSAEVDADSAVRIALLMSPRLEQAYATLELSDAERVQASTLPNPSVAFGRLSGSTEREIDRLLQFNVLGLVLLPWQARWAAQRHEVARLQAARTVIAVAADTRRAWFDAMAAEEALGPLGEAQEAADLAAELARSMVSRGNWSHAQGARVELAQAQARAGLVLARGHALATRERLTRSMGLPHDDARYRLPARLPDLPAEIPGARSTEARALTERLDVRAARADTMATADSLGLQRITGTFDAMSIGVARNSRFDRGSPDRRETERGFEFALPLPLFDWGQGRSARAEALYLRSAAEYREVAVRAASEAREAAAAWHAAHAEALHRRDHVLPLHRRLNQEVLLRYNGMLASAWDLLSESRTTSLAVVRSIEAQRDFWLADTDLKLATSGGITDDDAPHSRAGTHRTARLDAAAAGAVVTEEGVKP